MCNRFYKFAIKHEILHKKHFGFHTAHSARHAILDLVFQILLKMQVYIGIFINFSKDKTVDRTIISNKLNQYPIKML